MNVRRLTMAATVAAMSLTPFAGHAAGEPVVAITSPQHMEVIQTKPEVTYRPPAPGGMPTLTAHHPVTISGTATDEANVAGVQVVIYTGMLSQGFMATCTGCGTASATWTLSRDLLPGTYVLEALAVDAAGNRGRSERIQVFVVAGA